MSGEDRLLRMKPIVRRTYLAVSILDRQGVEASWTHDADAVILDLDDTVPDSEKSAARALVKESIPIAARGAAEVFVRVNSPLAQADIEASVWPGLCGIIYPGAESGADIDEVDSLLSEMERRRGVIERSLQIVILLQSGKGVWNVREIIKASPRVSSVGLDEINLCRALDIVPDAEFDPFLYAKGRIVIEGRAAKVQPVGISHPFGVLGRSNDADETYQHASRGKNLGFAGVICTDPSWVEPCNRALTPTEEQLEFYRETRRLFAEGVARGTAAVPYPGTTMMIDVPVDERARLTLELSELCAARDAEKAAAVKRAQNQTTG